MAPVPATIIVVEDNDEMRAFLRRQLVRDYQVVAAGDGEEGWRKVQMMEPDVVLSEAQMPRVDGWTLCKRIKESNELSFTPVILFAEGARADQDTGNDPGEETRGPGAEGDDGEAKRPSSEADIVLEKPFVLEELRQHLERFVSSRDLPDFVETAGPFLTQVVETVERRLDDSGFGVGQLADVLSLSRRHLTRRVKDEAGRTPTDLIRERRLERAKGYFDAGMETVGDVACMVGYQSASHFSQVFREVEGCSPTTYIERNT